MIRRMALCLAAFLAALAFVGAQETSGSARSVDCYVVIQEGASSEANALYLKKMGLQPEALRSFAPSRFELGVSGFSAKVEGVFGYEAETPLLVDRSGALGLYAVKAQIRAPEPPKVQKTVTVDFRLAELSVKGGIVQPGIRALELAARAAGWKSGLAWVLSMSRTGPGRLRATVALAR